MSEEKPLSKDLNELLNNFQKQRDILEKIIWEQARLVRIAYQALLAEGFTEAQALEIIKARGHALGG